MLFHTTDSPYYGRTKAEVWFKTKADAERAGFTEWTRKSGAPAGAEGLVAPTWEAGAFEGSAKPLEDGSSPSPEFTIKGNADSMLYHNEDSAFYNVTRAEAWFRNEDDARKAGFTPWISAVKAAPAEDAEDAETEDGDKPRGLFEPATSPFGPNSAVPGADGSAPGEEYTVKGNADSMLFHTTDSPYYGRTKAEVWFKTAADAEAAGFTPWNRKGKAEGLAAAPTWEAGAYAGSAKPLEGGAAPSPEFTVKGNEDSMLFHTTDSPYYGRTKAEVWFKTAADAEAAGFTPWNKRGTSAQAAVSAAKVEVGKYPGSAVPLDGGTSPSPEYTIKGNEDSKLYHTKESPFFGVTTAEVWFKNENDAKKAGFHAWKTLA
jgi:hypothetical protein